MTADESCATCDNRHGPGQAVTPGMSRGMDCFHLLDIEKLVIIKAVREGTVTEGKAQIAHGILDGMSRRKSEDPPDFIRIDVV